MAEKSFGVKEINFVGSTPKINSLSNLNLNAVNVAISTNATIGGTLSVTGNVSVGGVLTYEDVTNIDSVGLITARSGIVVKDDATFETANSNNIVFDKSDNALEFGNGVKSVFNNNLQIYNDGNNRFKGSSGGMFFGLPGSFQIGDGNFSNTKFEATGTHAILYSAGVKVARSHENRFEVGNPEASVGIGATISTIGNAQFVGVVTASSFIGSGANLTGIAVTEAPVTDYTITGDGSHYYFHGGGVDETAGDPDLYLIRGQKYRFNNTTGSSHPFEFRIADGGSAYSNGVSGDDEGVQFFTVPYDAPAKIFYICTVHSGMVGNIYIRGAGGQNDNVGVTTFSSGITVSGNASFAGNNVTMTASGSPNSFNVSGTSRFEIASIENAEIDGEIAHSGDTDTKISFDTNTIKFDTAGTERLRLTSSGRLGLNTDSPDTTFTVKSGGDAQMSLKNSSGTTKAYFGTDGAFGSAGTDDLRIRSDSSNIIFGFSGTERLRITSGGQVIIGDDDTDKANAHFDDLIVGANASTTETHGITIVCGNAATNGGIAFSDGSNGGADAYRGMISYQHNDNHMQFRTNAVERLRIHNDGDVTITATGDPHLKVTGPGQAQLTLTSTSGTDHCSINFGDSDDHDAGEIRYTNSSNSLNFDTNGTHRLTIDSSGHVLPASDSAYYLGSASVRWAQVNTDYLSAGISNTNGGVASFKGSNYNQVNITHSGNSGWGLLLTNSDSTSNGGYHESTSGNNNSCAIVNVNNDALYLGTNNNARWRVEHDGHFIPTGSGSYDMGSTGKRVRTFYAVNSLNTSDRNLKNTITESDLGLDFICKLKPVSYKWNQNEGESLDTKTHYGLISQDVEKVIIETGKTLDDFGAIDKPNGDPMGLSYNEFISPLIKAIQEQKAEIDALKLRIATLEGS